MPTQAVSVSNPGFLLDRLAADCSPLQEYRELTQNAIEAVERAIKRGLIAQGEILWDIDWPFLESRSHYKLCVIDNGDGMNADDIRQYINKLAVAGASGNHSLDGNYGVGAKITAGARNPQGVVYQSWVGGEGTMARFWRDPDENLYGLYQWELSDGSFSHTVPIAGDLKPEPIKAHGTKVALLGTQPDQNTALAPETATHANHWLTRYLNRRYFEFPDSVTVRVREFSKSDPSEWPDRPTTKAAEGAQWRTVTGHKANLEKYSTASGQVPVEGAVLHWWLLDSDRPGFSDQLRYWHASGHTAVLHRGEIYELKEGQTGRRALMACGVVFGTMRVVIYAEPAASAHLTTNTARSIVLLDGEPLPWESWAETFRKNMPPAIDEMMAKVAEGSNVDSHAKSIQERLKAIRHLFRLTRYRRTPSGESRTEGASPGGATPANSASRGPGSSPSGGRGGSIDNLYGEFVAGTDGDPATAVYPRLAEPSTEWRSLADHTREPGQMEDRAAEYMRELHTIYINGDFRAFTDMIDHFKSLYEGIEGAEVVIREAVREWFEQQLVETIMGVRALEGAQHWSTDDLENSLSSEALTAAVMPRYHVYNAIKRQLGSQLRSIKDMSAVAS